MNKNTMFALIKKTVIFLLRKILRVFWLFPIKQNHVIFEAYGGRKYACNPMFLSEYLEENYPKLFLKYWVYSDQPYQLKDKNIIQVKSRSIKYCYSMLTSSIVVFNFGVPRYLPFRKGQAVINTWHGGGAYKRNIISQDEQDLYNKQITHFVSSSKLFEKYVIRESFGFRGQTLNIGMPRNDIFFQNTDNLKVKVAKTLKIENNKCALYAPTWRNNKNKDEFGLDFNMLKKALEQRFGGEWVILKRMHYEINVKESKACDYIIDVGAYPDMQELLVFSDALITDYSSSVWDYSFLKKPCFLFAPDLKDYKAERDFYIDIHDWPFALAEDNESLCQRIQEYDEETYLARVAAHHQQLGSFETGTACRQLAKFVVDCCQCSEDKGELS